MIPMSIALGLFGVGTLLAGGSLAMARRTLSEHSVLFQGRTVAEVRALSAQLGVDLERFCVLAQRIMWGIEQPDLIHVPVAEVCAELRRELPDFFLTYVVVAFAERAAQRSEAAAAALAEARARVQTAPGGLSHPLAYVLPTDSEWACEVPQVTLEEVVPGTIYRVPTYFTNGTSPFLQMVYATIIRLRSGKLLIINPVALPAPIVEAIRALGPVSHLVTPVKFHSRYIAENQALFPDALCIGVPGHRVNPPSMHLRFDGFLDDRAPLFAGELEQVAVAGNELEETAFFHVPTRTAIFHDVLFANLAGVAGSPFWWRLYGLVFGLHDEVGVASYQTLMWTNVLALRRSLARVVAWTPERILLGHAPSNAIPENGTEVLRKSFGWIARLSAAEYVLRMGSYCAKQPTFLRDLIAYLIAQR